MTEPGDLTVQIVGQGFPVLIVHGWTTSGQVEAHDFEPIFTKRSEYRRIYVDLPGMGTSPVGNATDLDSMLESVTRWIDNNMKSSHFLLVGTSCGAYLARALAHRYAGAIDGLLLRVPVVEPASKLRDVGSFVPAISSKELMSSLSEADRQDLGDVSVQTHEYIDVLRHKHGSVWLPASASSDSAALDIIRNDPNAYKLTAEMPKPTAPFMKPALILTGRQDTDVGYRDGWSLVASFPRATFVALDRASHGFPVDTMEVTLFEALVDDWLRRIEELQRSTRS
nr:pimeloyl-[acyl-carrier protein] methyl ester esterase [Quercus suber]